MRRRRKRKRKWRTTTTMRGQWGGGGRGEPLICISDDDAECGDQRWSQTLAILGMGSAQVEDIRTEMSENMSMMKHTPRSDRPDFLPEIIQHLTDRPIGQVDDSKRLRKRTSKGE
eukprot:3732186-Pyramimonas_sp.AAC.1